MVGDMFTDKTRYKKITVIITLVHAQLDADIAFPANACQIPGKKLIFQKFIRRPLIDE